MAALLSNHLWIDGNDNMPKRWPTHFTWLLLRNQARLASSLEELIERQGLKVVLKLCNLPVKHNNFHATTEMQEQQARKNKNKKNKKNSNKNNNKSSKNDNNNNNNNNYYYYYYYYWLWLRLWPRLLQLLQATARHTSYKHSSEIRECSSKGLTT